MSRVNPCKHVCSRKFMLELDDGWPSNEAGCVSGCLSMYHGIYIYMYDTYTCNTYTYLHLHAFMYTYAHIHTDIYI